MAAFFRRVPRPLWVVGACLMLVALLAVPLAVLAAPHSRPATKPLTWSSVFTRHSATKMTSAWSKLQATHPQAHFQGKLTTKKGTTKLPLNLSGTNTGAHFVYVDDNTCDQYGNNGNGITGYQVTSNGLIPLGYPAPARCDFSGIFSPTVLGHSLIVAPATSSHGACLYHLASNTASIDEYTLDQTTGTLTPVGGGLTGGIISIMSGAVGPYGNQLYLSVASPFVTAVASLGINPDCTLSQGDFVTNGEVYTDLQMLGGQRFVALDAENGSYDVYRIGTGNPLSGGNLLALSFLGSTPVQTESPVSLVTQKVGTGSNAPFNVYTGDTFSSDSPTVEASTISGSATDSTLVPLAGSPVSDTAVEGSVDNIFFDRTWNTLIQAEPSNGTLAFYRSIHGQFKLSEHLKLPKNVIPLNMSELGQTLFINDVYGTLDTCYFGFNKKITCSIAAYPGYFLPAGIATI